MYHYWSTTTTCPFSYDLRRKPTSPLISLPALIMLLFLKNESACFPGAMSTSSMLASFSFRYLTEWCMVNLTKTNIHNFTEA